MRIMKKSFALLAAFAMLLSLCVISTAAVAPVSVPLYAGQTQEVGQVVVTNDEDNLHITYQLNSDTINAGWGLTELHLAVGQYVTNIPVNKSGNPVPGKFEHISCFDVPQTSGFFTVPIPADMAIGEDVVIAAHAVIQREDITTNAVAPYGADDWVEFEQGTRYDNSDVRIARSNPDNALALETAATESENFFVSLGFQSQDNDVAPYIVLKFDNPIVNGEGADVQVVEDTWGLPYPYETANVFVSNDLVNWTPIGTANNQKPMDRYHTFTNLFLPDGMSSAKYVKVQDTSIRSDFDTLYPAQKETLDGFDLNAVLALHNNETHTVYSETAWGRDDNEYTFVPQGNWATYFTYTLAQ